MQIFKQVIPLKDDYVLRLPGELLSIEEQHNELVAYFLTGDTHEYVIMIRGTGHEINTVDGYKFFGTKKLFTAQLMFHVFVKEII